MQKLTEREITSTEILSVTEFPNLGHVKKLYPRFKFVLIKNSKGTHVLRV
jgi:hypothetical protein